MERERETRIDAAPTACSNIDDTIIINVGGVRHEVLRDTLQRIPDTLLSSTDNVQNHYRFSAKEYFFDRHPQVFSAILNYYRTGELHLPSDVCNVLIKNELEYWEIPETSIEDCCWMRYNAHWDQMNTLAQFETKHNAKRKNKSSHRTMSACWNSTQPRLWAFLDDPYSSIPAKVRQAFLFCMLLTMQPQNAVSLLSWMECFSVPLYCSNINIQTICKFIEYMPLWCKILACWLPI